MAVKTNHELTDVLERIDEIKESLTALDPIGLQNSLNNLFSKLPELLHMEAEAYYHSLFLLSLTILGFNIHGEVAVANGLVDGIMTLDGITYVIEIKYVKDSKRAKSKSLKESLAEAYKKAFKQFENKSYAKAFDGKSSQVIRCIVCVGGKNKVLVIFK